MDVRCNMMTSSNGNFFRVTGHLCGEFTGPRWIHHTKASDAELWCYLWSKRLSKQWWGWWFETLSHPLWRHRNECHRWYSSQKASNAGLSCFFVVSCEIPLNKQQFPTSLNTMTHMWRCCKVFENAVNVLRDELGWYQEVLLWSANRTSIGSDNGLSPIGAKPIYIHQCWVFISWTLRNKLKWIFT